MSCSHEKRVYRKEFVGFDSNDNEIFFDVPTLESACKDIDLHRYKCTLCGEVGYYSNSARMFYENGIPSSIIKP